MSVRGREFFTLWVSRRLRDPKYQMLSVHALERVLIEEAADCDVSSADLRVSVGGNIYQAVFDALMQELEPMAATSTK